MQPPDEVRLPGNQNPRSWWRLTRWVSLNRPLAWLVGLTAGLILFLAWLPPHVRMFFWRGLQTQGILASMTLGFSLLALSLLDRLMWGITQIGNGIVIVALALILYFAGDHLLAYELILGALTLWLVVELVKALVHRRRPFIRLSQARIVGHRAIGRSFPSGHTSQAFFMATVMAAYFHAGVWAVCLLYAVALLVGITRVYVGAHYPRDVLAGAILGSAWGLMGGIVSGQATIRIG